MNEKDLNNVWFILNSSREELESWWDELDALDQAYAMHIISAYREELYRLEETYTDVPSLNDEDLSMAKNYLRKFQL